MGVNIRKRGHIALLSHEGSMIETKSRSCEGRFQSGTLTSGSFGTTPALRATRNLLMAAPCRACVRSRSRLRRGMFNKRGTGPTFDSGWIEICSYIFSLGKALRRAQYCGAEETHS